MADVNDFIKWVLRKTKRSYIPEGASFPLPAEEIGCEREMEYLMGGMVQPVTQSMIEYRWESFYSKNGWTRAQYDYYTRGWVERGVWVSDCGGLFDGYRTQVLGIRTDYNVPMLVDNEAINYKQVESWSDLPVGKTVYVVNSKTGNENHVGWICGHMANGEPLIVEARGLAYGVVITRWTQRNFSTCSDLRTFDTAEVKEMIFEVTNPMKEGTAVKAMQAALNAAGYKDHENKRLDEDGKWGKRSQAAFEKLLAKHDTACGNLKELTITLDGKAVNTYKVVST